jgi:hypothetical protein
MNFDGTAIGDTEQITDNLLDRQIADRWRCWF